MSHAGAREAWLSEGRQRRGRCVVRVRVRVCHACACVMRVRACTCVMRVHVCVCVVRVCACVVHARACACVGGSLRTPSPDRSPFLRDGQGLLRRA